MPVPPLAGRAVAVAACLCLARPALAANSPAHVAPLRGIEEPLRIVWRTAVPPFYDESDKPIYLAASQWAAAQLRDPPPGSPGERRSLCNFFPAATERVILAPGHRGLDAFAPRPNTAAALAAGEIDWSFTSEFALWFVTNGARSAAQVEGLLHRFGPAGRAALARGGVGGRVTVAGGQAYYVDALPPASINLPRHLLPNEEPYRSFLVGICLETGKLRVKLGSEELALKRNAELIRSDFLGPPLALGSLLWVLNEKNDIIRLVCIDPEYNLGRRWDDRGILGCHPIADVPQGKMDWPSRRLHSATPIVAGGNLICPTHTGVLVAVCARDGAITWTYRYRHSGRAPVEVTRSCWRATPPLGRDGYVVYAPPDGTRLLCLDAASGAFHWDRDRGEGLFPACIHSGNVVEIEEKACRALRLADGTEAWRLSLPGQPAGEGFQHGHRYFVPVAPGRGMDRFGVAVIDLRDGGLERLLLAPPATELGNLARHDEGIISLTPTELVVLRPRGWMESGR